MNNRNERIKTTSGLMFRGAKNYLADRAMHWRLTFDHEIDRERLQRALDAALRVCPYMSMSLEEDKDGIWYVPNPAPALLCDEVPERLGGEETGHHLFCLVCGKDSAELVAHHGLTDGAGLSWFWDALLAAYYEEPVFAYKGAGTEDYARDPMDIDLKIPDGYIPETVMPERRFTFPEATGNAGSAAGAGRYHYVAAFSREDLRSFCREYGCSFTEALAALILQAVQRVHPENEDPICIRCPIDSRRILGLPHTFMNASLPQILAFADAKKAAVGRIDEIIEELNTQMTAQTDRDRVAAFTGIVAARLRHAPLPYTDKVMDTFKAPIVLSDLGMITPSVAASHITRSEVYGHGATSLMVNLSAAGDRCFLYFVQTFEGTAYVDALSQVMEEYGMCMWFPSRSSTESFTQASASGSFSAESFAQAPAPGDFSHMPRFMDRMARVVWQYADRPALVDAERILTYAGLDRESGRIYHYLKRHGVGRESLVQVVMPRCAGFFSCIAGVLRAGAAFIALESTYPAERIAYIREDAACACVLDEALYRQIMDGEEYLGGHEETDIHDACYAVYTSGSTGNPKGVLHEYGSLDVRALPLPEMDQYPQERRGMMESFYFVAAIYFECANLLRAATIHIIGRDVVRNFSLLSKYIEENQLEWIFMTPSYARVYKKPASCLKEIVVGGEPAGMLYYPGGRPRIHNAYGMSETGFFLLETDLDHSYDIAPVGLPTVQGIDLHLEDDEGRRIEGAGEGELCYRNLFFRGYINLPEKTAQALRDGVFHTGDLARRDERGVYYILGRTDDMFKINGNRIEPAEIERRVREATGLSEVVARGFSDGSHAFICAYFLREEALRLGIWDGEQLTCSLDSLRKSLPEYMIPAYYIGLDEFPRNANGKLAKILLKVPDRNARRREYVAPADEREALFCDLMARALKQDRVGAEDDFYEIGGDSMGAVVLLGLCAEEGFDVPLSMLYKKRTPRQLAAALKAERPGTQELAEAARKALSGPLPIIDGQKPHLKQLLTAPDELTYNLPQLLKLREGTDLNRLCKAMDAVFRAHPALLSTFRECDGVWCQVFDESLFEPTRIISMSDNEFEQLKESLVAPLRGLSAAPHRRALYHTDSADYMFWDIHHIIADGSSLMLLREQVFACYEDPDYRIPEDLYAYYLMELGKEQNDTQAAQYKEAQAYYESWFVGGAGKEQVAVTDKKMPDDAGTDQGADTGLSLTLTPDLPGPEGAAAILTGHREVARTDDGGIALFLAATAMAASRLNGRRSSLVYMVYHGRDDQTKRQSVGMFATEIPVYIDPDKLRTPDEILSDIKDQLNFGMAHCGYPFARLHPAPLCNTVLFNYQKDTMDLGRLSAIVSERVPLPMGQNGMVITGLIDRRGIDALTWYCGYSKGWYSRERIQAFHQAFKEAAAWLRVEKHA